MRLHNAISEAQNFAELLRISEKAERGISFWGLRYIIVPGYEDKDELSSIRSRIIDLVKYNPHFDELERSNAQKLISRLSHLEDDLQKNLQKRFWFIRFFARIIYPDIYPNGWFDKTTSIRIRISCCTVFSLYTQEQYKNIFKITPKDYLFVGKWIDEIKRWNPPELEAVLKKYRRRLRRDL